MTVAAAAATSATKRFVGYSSDTKPTGVPAGTWFEELDTGLVYRFDGTQWMQPVLWTDQRIVEQLDRTNELLSHLLDVMMAMNDP
jgi:hypothetical protein